MKAWNCSLNPTLRGHSPHFIMYGQADKLLSQKFDTPQTQEARTEEIKAIQDIRRRLPKILRDNYERYKEQYNKSRIQLYLEEGVKILMAKNPFPTKMEHEWRGPVTITKVFSC